AAVRALADLPGVLLLESALVREPVGRYSFLTADPFYFERLPRAEFGVDPLANLRERTAAFATETVPGLPPFQGGAAGLLSYELGRAWERLPVAGRDEFDLPALAVGLYDWVLAWDHVANRAWVISQGFPETDCARRADRAAIRLREVCARLEASTAIRATPPLPPLRKGGQGEWRGVLPHDSIAQQTLTPDNLAPHFPAAGPPGILSNFSREKYLRAVERAIEYIRAGDIFQVNLSQRLLFPRKESPLDLYARLREKNPAPFAGYFACDEWAIVSASPERFVCVQGDEVETRP